MNSITRAHVITGSFGSGKTTAIRRLMAGKPESELWMVILNEFTDAGLDALCVAETARGRWRGLEPTSRRGQRVMRAPIDPVAW